jgi:hypothetical protein
VTQPVVPEFDTDELLTATKLNQLGAAVSFIQAVDGTYTPALSATGATPNIGATGTLRGIWWRTSNHMSGSFEISLSGAGVSFVGTSWRVTLPFAADLTLHTFGALAADSDNIGDFQTQSPNSVDVRTGSILLSNPAEVIFYSSDSNASIGGALWTGTSGRIKGRFHYVADPSLF